MKRSKSTQLGILEKLETLEHTASRYQAFIAGEHELEEIRTPDWTDHEAYNIDLMIRDGLLRSERITGAPWFDNYPGGTYAETYIFLTSAGHDCLDERNFLTKWLRNILSNIATIVASVSASLAIAWALKIWGP